MPSIRLIVGLGNPGKEHERSRHNAGFWLVERFAAQAGVVLRKDPKFQALVGRHEPNGAWLVLPQSYMNSSGRPVQMLAGFFRIPASEILVAHDELDFPPGTARIKQGGGIAGHNGLKDISQRLGTHEYWRLRIGIGHPGDKDAVTDYVLRRPSAEDRTAIDASIAKALEVLPLCLAGDLQGAMQKLHTQTGPEQAPKAEAQEPAPEPGEQRRTKEPAPKPQPKEPAPRAEKPTAQEPAKAQPGGTLRSLLGSLLHPTRKK